MTQYEYIEGCEKKDPWIATALAFFLGMFGVHWYYLGDKKKFKIHLGIGLFGILFPILITIIAFIAPSDENLSMFMGSSAIFIWLFYVVWQFIVFIEFIALLLKALKTNKSNDEQYYEFELDHVAPESRCYVPLEGDKNKEVKLMSF